MSRRKQARPRLCKRDDEDDDTDEDLTSIPESKKIKLANEDELERESDKIETVATAAEPEIFRCETCEATFENLMHFMDHRNYQCETGILPYKSENGSRSGTPSSMDSAGSNTGSMDSLLGRIDPEHVPSHVGVNEAHPIPCQFCDKAFAKISHLKVHEQVHVDMMPFNCKFCSRLFRHKRSRDRHVKLHTGDKKFKCGQCDAAFARSDHLKSHQKTHGVEESFPCPVCSLEYPTMAALMSHQNAHKSKPISSSKCDLKCTECGGVFYSEKDMEGHSCAMLTGKKTFQCQHCTAICVGSTALALHTEHAHTGGLSTEQNKCPICFKCFLALEELTAHMKVHELPGTDINSDSIINPSDIPSMEFGSGLLQNSGNSGICPTDVLVCPYCLRDNFETLEGLELHMQGVHSVKPTEVYTCNYCNAPYKNLYSLHEHMRAIHQNQPSMGIKYPCSRCGKEYPSIEALQDHKKRMHHFKHKHAENIYSCTHCSLTCLSSASLQEHVQLIHGDVGVPKTKHESNHQKNSRSTPVSKPAKFSSSKLKESLAQMNDSPTIINVPEPSHLLRHLRSPLKTSLHSPTATVHHAPASSPNNHLQTPPNLTPGGRGEHNQEKITCDQCNASFSDLSTYQTHMKLHIDSVLGQFACRQCNKLFLSEEQLETHISSHYLSVLSEFGCTSCNKNFNKPDELQKHLMDIHAHHLYKCSMCKEVFDSKVNIQVHFAIKHSNECKMYKCITCDTVFRSETEWQVHLRVTHLQIAKPYRCLFCKESFSSEMDLQCHLATHNKPFKCSMCEESFLVEFLLDKHLQNVHSSGASNSTGISPKSGRDSTENGFPPINVKVEKDPDTGKQELVAPSSSGLYSNLLSTSSNHSNLMLSRNGSLLGDGVGSLYSNLGVSAGGSMVWRSPDDLYRCNICDLKFSEVSGLQNHKLQDHGVKYSPIKSPYSPSSSPKQSTSGSSDSMSAIYNSMMSHPPTELVTLSTEKSSNSLLHDALKSTMSLPLNLPDSNSKSTAFTEKLASTFGEKLCLACPFCSQTFKGKADLEKHSKIHLNTGSQKCNICDEVFASTGILAEHKLSHCKIQQGNVCVACKIPIRNEDQFYLHSQEHGFQGAVMQCIVCRQTLASMLELQMHGRHHFQNKSAFHTCCVCLKSFESSENLVSKLNSSGRTYYVCKPCYHGECNEYPCSQCNATFDSMAALEAHAITHKKSYQCIKCQESFSSEHEIQLHVATHMMKEGNIHECKLCFVILDSPAKLQCHLIEHTYKNSEYRCSICGHTFENAVEIQSHALEHGISARKYGCNQCNQKFFFSAELENHMYLHKITFDQTRNTKQYDNQSLLINPLSSQSLNDIATHKNIIQSDASSCFNVQSQYIQSSSSEDDLCCSKCDQTFSTVFELTNHYKKCHADIKEKTIQCSHCSETFTSLGLLQGHFFAVHAANGTEIRKSKRVCMECGKECSTESNLLSHLNTHRKGSKHVCPSCSKSFVSSSSLTAHVKTCSRQKPHECPMCHKRFTKKSSKMEHMKTHTGEKVYPCSYCGNLFSGKSNVQDHMKSCKTGPPLDPLEEENQTESLSGTSDETVASVEHISDEELSDPEKDGMKPEVTSTSNIPEETNIQN